MVDHLCEMGVELHTVDQEGNGPLWVALRSRQENIAAKLVSKPAAQSQELPLVQYVHIMCLCSSLIHNSAASTSQHVVAWNLWSQFSI